MEYKDFSAADFICDEYFQNWVIQADEKMDSFWSNWLLQNPEKKEIVGKIKKSFTAYKIQKLSAVRRAGVAFTGFNPFFYK